MPERKSDSGKGAAFERIYGLPYASPGTAAGQRKRADFGAGWDAAIESVAARGGTEGERPTLDQHAAVIEALADANTREDALRRALERVVGMAEAECARDSAATIRASLVAHEVRAALAARAASTLQTTRENAGRDTYTTGRAVLLRAGPSRVVSGSRTTCAY